MRKLTIEEMEDHEAQSEVLRHEERERLSLQAFEKWLESANEDF